VLNLDEQRGPPEAVGSEISGGLDGLASSPMASWGATTSTGGAPSALEGLEVISAVRQAVAVLRLNQCRVCCFCQGWNRWDAARVRRVSVWEHVTGCGR
jgi:hypothetical protein